VTGKHHNLEFHLKFETYIYAFRNVCKAFFIQRLGKCRIVAEQVTQALDAVHHLPKDVGGYAEGWSSPD